MEKFKDGSNNDENFVRGKDLGFLLQVLNAKEVEEILDMGQVFQKQICFSSVKTNELSSLIYIQDKRKISQT